MSSIEFSESIVGGKIGIFSTELKSYSCLNVFLLISFKCEGLFSPMGPVWMTFADLKVLEALRSIKLMILFASILLF